MNNQFHNLRKMPEPIDSIPRLAMFLAVIRPSKRHLIGKTYKELSQTIWDRDETGYSFKKSHAIAYAQLVVVHMNLIEELGDSIVTPPTTPDQIKSIDNPSTKWEKHLAAIKERMTTFAGKEKMNPFLWAKDVNLQELEHNAAKGDTDAQRKLLDISLGFIPHAKL